MLAIPDTTRGGKSYRLRSCHEDRKMGDRLLMILAMFSMGIFMVAGKQCYETNTLDCGDHGEAYDDFCESLNVSRIDTREISCPVNCGLLRGTFRYKDRIEVYYVGTGCTEEPEAGCISNEDFERYEPDYFQYILYIESQIPDLEIETSDACTCVEDLCNSSLRTLASECLLLLLITAIGLHQVMFA